MDYYELKQETFKEHAEYLDTLLAPLHWVDVSQEFRQIQEQSMQLLEFCQKVEQPLTGRVILLPEFWVTKEDWENQLDQWSRMLLKEPFRYLVFVGAGLGKNEREPLRRFRPDAEVYLVDLAQPLAPADVYQFLIRTWSQAR